jgi:hypothetical protein
MEAYPLTTLGAGDAALQQATVGRNELFFFVWPRAGVDSKFSFISFVAK